MRILKDNFLDGTFAILKPYANVALILVSLVLASGFMLAMVDGVGPAVAGIVLTLALVLLAITPSRIMCQGGFIGRSKHVQSPQASNIKHVSAAVKYPTKKQLVYLQQALTVGQMTPLGGSVPFPFGHGFLTMFLDIYITIVIGTGTGAISEGELLFVKNVYMKTDKHGPIIDNVCGRALFRRAQKCMSTASYKDAIAATSATYVVSIPIHFANPRLRRKEDTLLDMAGVNSMDLQITLGSAADLFTSPGTATVAVAADISVEKTITAVDLGNQPIRQPYICPINPWDPNVQANIELPKISDLGILDLMIFTSNSASANVPWSGTPAANVVKRFTFEDESRKIFDQVPVGTLRNDNKMKFQYETIVPGLFIFDFIEEDSVWQGYAVGGKAKVNLNWLNDTLSTSQVSGLIDGTTNLKNLVGLQ